DCGIVRSVERRLLHCRGLRLRAVLRHHRRIARHLLSHLASRAGCARGNPFKLVVQPEAAIGIACARVSTGLGATQRRANVKIDLAGTLAGYRLTEKIEIDAALPTFQI